MVPWVLPCSVDVFHSIIEQTASNIAAIQNSLEPALSIRSCDWSMISSHYSSFSSQMHFKGYRMHNQSLLQRGFLMSYYWMSILPKGTPSCSSFLFVTFLPGLDRIYRMTMKCPISLKGINKLSRSNGRIMEFTDILFTK